MKYEFSTKLNSRKNSAGVTVEKVRVWLEESKNNRFLSDAGFIRGAAVDILIDHEHHNFNECKTKGVAKMVDKDYIVSPHEVIEIRFNI